jgi:subtilisin family serine protease
VSKRLVLPLSIVLSFIAAAPQAGIKVTGRSARGNVLAAIEPVDDSKGVRVLIEVDAKPGDRAAVAARAADLDRDLHRIDTKLRATAKSQGQVEIPAPKVGRIYTHVFQGVSATVPSSEIAALRALSYVRSVHTETIYKATSIDGVSIVKAPPVWTSFSVRGKGIVAAIIDTGIDYNHAAFGGGFGPGHRIAGGYDFVDNDADPMDENGHGTHVAGIVAGNGGGVTGVAPEAILMAFRVLDRSARGSESDVMAGIERAVDPNQDGDTKDHVDVINMSLGGPGNSDDLLSRAVDAATAAGVVVCVAAGNEGLDVGTIDSPGAARTAITVGATGQVTIFIGGTTLQHDSRAYFSSRGPVGRSLDDKPEVMAPGVGIASAKLGGGTIEMSGTSMATPFVAGVAALLRLIHPQWTPADIKAAMVSTAGTDLGPGGDVGAMIGGGLLDAVAAANAVVLPVPSQLSFGVGGAAAYSRTLPLRLTNRGTRQESFAVHGVTGFEKTIVVVPPSFTLDPGETIDLSVTLSVAPASLGAPAEIPGGFLRFEGSTSFHVPFAVVRGAAVTVQYAPEKGFLVWPLEQGRPVQPILDFPPRVVQGGGEATLILGVDQYDLLMLDEDGRLLVAEGKNADGASTVVLSPDDAKNAIAAVFADEQGLPLEPVVPTRPCADHLTVFVPGSTADSPMYIDVAAVPGNLPPLKTSDMSNRFTLFRSRACFDSAGQSVHAAVLDPVAGVHSSVALANLPSAWLGTTVRYSFEPGDTNRQARLGARLQVDHDDEYRAGSLLSNGTSALSPLLGNDDAFKKYSLFVAQGSSKSVMYDAFVEAQAQPLTGPLTVLTQGPYCTIRNGRLAVAPLNGTNDLTFVPVENELQLNDGPVHARRFAAPDGLAPGFLTLQTQWFGPLHEHRYYESLAAETKLFGPDGSEIPSPYSVDFLWTYFPLAGLQPGPYRVVSVDSHYRNAGMQGRATSTATFDTRKEDITDPEISTFRVLNGKGETRSRIAAGDTAQIVFSLADYEVTCGLPACNNQIGRYDSVRVDATKLWIRPHGSTVWTPMSLRMTGGATESVTGKLSQTLPGGIEFRSEAKLPAGYYDVRIQGEDRNGNQTDLTVEPAFAVEAGRGRAVGQ